jgi:manganese/zinc/iron transport system substrate-binding protein
MKSRVLKFFGILLLASILFGSLMGCGAKSGRAQKFRGWMAPNGKIKILSTTAQIGDLVEEIGGDRMDYWVLIQGDLDPHGYELVKGDDEKLSRADRVFYNGLGLEHGASLLNTLQSHPASFSVGGAILESYPQKILRKNQLVDPHIWMDISLWKKAVDPIAEQLIKLDPEGKEIYLFRAERLKEKMDKAHQEILTMLQAVPAEKRYLVTSHDAFHYFTKIYLSDPGEGDIWIERFAAPEGLAPDGQLNPADIAAIIQYLKDKKISVLFPESNVSRDSIKKIVAAGRELGLNISICSEALYGDAMGSQGELHYLDMMYHNAKILSYYLGE